MGKQFNPKLAIKINFNFSSASGFSSNQYNTIGGPCTINGGGRSIFQDINR